MNGMSGPGGRRSGANKRIASAAIGAVLIAALGIGIWRASVMGRKRPAAVPFIAATTAPPASALAAVTPRPTTSWIDIVGANLPELAGKQPSFVPLDLRRAARILVDAPVYLDQAGQIWITQPTAQPIQTVLKRAADESVHVVTWRVVLVHYANDESGTVRPEPVRELELGHFVLATAAGNAELPGSVLWVRRRCFDWTNGDAFAFSTTAGAEMVQLIRTGYGGLPTAETKYWQCKEATNPQANEQTDFALDSRGVLAWRSSGGAARFVDGQWHDLSATIEPGESQGDGWSRPILAVVPYLDGSVLRIGRDGQGQIALDVTSLDHAPVPAKQIDSLIDQLSDSDPDRRNSAYEQLLKYHSAAWPQLLKRQDSESPGASQMIGMLLHNKVQATLGGLTPNPGPVEVAQRFADGGVLLYLRAGVTLPTNTGQEATQVVPAWVAVATGSGATLVPSPLAVDLDLSRAKQLQRFGVEWVVTDPVLGPCRLYGDQIKPILPKEQIAFNELVGIDVQGRWLMRRPGTDRPTLIIDPALPDPTPRLPIWTLDVKDGRAGWDKDNWPVVDKGGRFALHAEDWMPAKDGDGFFQTTQDNSPAGKPPNPASSDTPKESISHSTTQGTTTRTATSAAATEMGPPGTSPILLRDADGREYFGGVTSIFIQKPGSPVREFLLSGELAGDGQPARLIAASDWLFLFNQAGRVIRLKKTPQAAQPLAIEAIFTRQVPAPQQVQRIWLDPAGRIDMAFDEHELAIMFPSGEVPPAIATKMPQDQLDAVDDPESARR
jgi:hypothetical protein